MVEININLRRDRIKECCMSQLKHPLDYTLNQKFPRYYFKFYQIGTNLKTI